jgi:putative transposase-like DNA-binding protein
MELDQPVQEAVRQVTRLSFEVSRFLQYHLQRLFERKTAIDTFLDLTSIPDITNTTWMRKLFIGFADGGFEEAELDASYSLYLNARTRNVPIPPGNAIPPQALTIFAKDFATNIATHIDRLFTIVARRAYVKTFSRLGVPTKEAKSLAAAIVSVLEEATTTAILHDELLTKFQDREVRWLMECHLQAGGTWRGKLHYIYVQNLWLSTQASRLCVLTPIFSVDSKYITIDTDVLHSLLGNKPGTGSNKSSFGQRQMCQWALNFRIPSRVGHEGLGKYFWFNIKTDGVGASLLVNRWVWVKKKKAEKGEKGKEEVIAEAKARQAEAVYAVRAAVGSNTPVIIGADPGRKDLLTIVTDLGDGTTPAAKHFSNKRYYHEAKFKYRLRKQKCFLEKSGLLTWWEGVPSLKLGISGRTLENVSYLFNSKRMVALYDLRGSKKCRKLRWKAYIHQKKTLSRFAAEILSDLPTDKVTVIGFGDSSFNHASKGHAPTPGSRQLRHLLRHSKEKWRWPKWKTHVLDIWEFNTSKVCSQCHATRRLGEEKGVTEKHFVRRCEEPSCQAIWNRDINAALNMVYLTKLLLMEKVRPPLFSKSLPKNK